MVLKKFYEKIVLILSLITLILVIYYLAKTYFKHHNILEKFSEKILYKDVKFRDCEIYFTKDKEGCDRDYAANDKDTCKYKFENWKEIDKIGDGAIKKHKVYVDNKLNEGDYVNIKEETRCFYKLGEDDDKSGDNIMIIDNNYYAYNDFYPFNIDNSICNTVVPIKTGISGKYFYEFILDKDNNLVDIKKVSINAQQNSFIVDSTFTISKFIEQYGNGLEYYNEKAFKIYKISKFPDFDVKVHKFTYNYLCYNTQIKNYSIINAKLQLNNFLALSSAEKLIQLPDIDTNITGIRWDDYKNSDSNIREDKKSAIIKALEDRKKVIHDEIEEKDSATSTALSIIKQKIIDNDVIGKYQLTTYYDSNKEKWNEAKFLNQFSVHNYKREYLTKSADATFNYENIEVNIRIKNNFVEGLKYIKVKGHYGDDKYVCGEPSPNTKNKYVCAKYIKSRIEHIKNKEFIKERHLERKYYITNFRDIYMLTGINKYNHGLGYTMWFSGYFYAHETGNYDFGTRSNNFTHIFINDELVTANEPGGVRAMQTVEQNYGNINKGEICKIDIFFGTGQVGSGELEIFWRLNNSNNIYSSDWDNKTWIYHIDPDVNPLNHTSKIPIINGNEQYVDGREHKLTYKMANDYTGDLYYIFQNTDFIYDIIVNMDVEAKILVIGGGGGGGRDFGGGGGAGGYIEDKKLSLNKNDKITIKVGKGGNGGAETLNDTGIDAKNGENTLVTINNSERYKALGGGSGGSNYPPRAHGGDGASGGGAASHSGKPGSKGGKTTNSEQGNNGMREMGWHITGGGGGAGKPAYGTDGGKGKMTNIMGNYIYFAGGGGGSGWAKEAGDGGSGGGGAGGGGNRIDGAKGGDGINYGENAGGHPGGGWNKPGGRGGDNTGGGGGAATHGNTTSRGGRGGSGVVILRIKNTPSVKLAKCNYYIPPISQITPYLHKSDVMNSKISFEVRNSANPKSLFYSSYIYLKKGNYKFNFDIDTSKHKNLYTKSKIIIYNDKDKKTFISVYTDNMVTKKWVYIPDTKYYIINLCILYISGGKYDIPFSVKAMYTSGDKSNAIKFSNSELSIDKYEGVTSSDSANYKDMTGYIYIHDSGDIDRINNKADEYNNNFNKFLESYFLLNTSFGKVIDYFKLLGRRNNEKKSNINIQKIDKLIEFLNNIDLNGYLDKSNDNMNLSGDAKSIFAQNTILNINDYITFKQYKQDDKNELKGADYTFDMLKHADRSIYIEVF